MDGDTPPEEVTAIAENDTPSGPVADKLREETRQGTGPGGPGTSTTSTPVVNRIQTPVAAKPDTEQQQKPTQQNTGRKRGPWRFSPFNKTYPTG